LEKYPEAEGEVRPIEKMNNNDRGDFVVCLQTIGINTKFNNENIISCVKKIVKATNCEGMLTFNVGPKAKDHFECIDELLRDSFSKVDVLNYGALNKKMPKCISYLLARVMYKYPSLAKTSSNPCRLYIARDKSLSAPVKIGHNKM